MSIGDWRPLDDNGIRDTPPTQTGVVPDQNSDVGSQSTRIAADPVLMADAPDRSPSGTPVHPPSDIFGPGSLGSPVDGWNPAREGG